MYKAINKITLLIIQRIKGLFSTHLNVKSFISTKFYCINKIYYFEIKNIKQNVTKNHQTCYK